MNFESTREIIAESLKNKGSSFQICDYESIYLQYQPLDLTQIKERAKQWTTLFKTAYNWAEVVIEFRKLPEEFRCEVWEVWQKLRFSD